MSKSFTEKRPWGEFRQFTSGEPVTVKIIKVKAGERLSLQHHKRRNEFWLVLSGTPQITIGEEIAEAKMGDEFYIPVATNHRLQATGEESTILEISSGDFSEDDVVRLEDDYGRA